MAIDANTLFLSLVSTVITAIVSLILWNVRRMMAKVNGMEVDIAVVKSQLAEFVVLKTDVKEDHDRVVRLEERIEKCKQDLNRNWDALRKVTTNHGG